MTQDDMMRPPDEVRRRDREVRDEAWIRGLLQRAPVGYLATIQSGQPFINSNLFVYDASRHVIYLHTARTGRTPANVAADERICFTVSEMGRLLPAAEALEFSVEYASVVVFGKATILTDPEEATYGLHLLLDKYAPHLERGRDYRAVTTAERARTAVYRLTIDAWSGKQKVAPPDFPGAFFYGEALPSP